MAETIDDISIDWTDEEGVQKVRELKKEVLTRGAWATVMFAYQEVGRGAEEFGPVKFRVGRYQKRNGRFSRTPSSMFPRSSRPGRSSRFCRPGSTSMVKMNKAGV